MLCLCFKKYYQRISVIDWWQRRIRVFHQVLVVPQTQVQLQYRVWILVALAFKVYDTTIRYSRTRPDVDIPSYRIVTDRCSEYIRTNNSLPL